MDKFFYEAVLKTMSLVTENFIRKYYKEELKKMLKEDKHIAAEDVLYFVKIELETKHELLCEKAFREAFLKVEPQIKKEIVDEPGIK